MPPIPTPTLLKPLVVLIVLVAIIASAAQSETRPRAYVDGWAYNVVYNASHGAAPVDVITENSRGQNGYTTQRARTSHVSSASASTSASPGFDWGDAAIGAFVSLAVVLLATAAAAILRRSRTRVAGA